jgi:hypothetical protein
MTELLCRKGMINMDIVKELQYHVELTVKFLRLINKEGLEEAETLITRALYEANFIHNTVENRHVQ